MKEYVKEIYHAMIENAVEKFTHQHQYRQHKETFKNNALSGINNRMDGYSFAVRTGAKASLESDLTILEGNISIENKGKGKQVLVKTELALKRSDDSLDILLLEEPENHLSYSNTNKMLSKLRTAKLVAKLRTANSRQIFIATHSTLISTRLDLRKSILLGPDPASPLRLDQLRDTTAKFFMKAPDNNMLEFVLAEKVFLVEGDAEFMLMELMYKKVTGNTLQQDGVHVISVDGTSFKRYMDVGKIIKNKTAVIRDNDGAFDELVTKNYEPFVTDSIKVFADNDNARSTFEICVYQDNRALCDGLFSKKVGSKPTQEYMLKNKAEAAFVILSSETAEFVVPAYIKQAIEWIKG
jgi:predicted ATP-dependent endonuclease of OLD family